MDPQLWLLFAAASFLMAVVPGPGVAAIIAIAVGSGRRTALFAVIGMAAGNALAMSLSLAGAGALLAGSPLAFMLLKWAGAAYLIILGLLALRSASGQRAPTAVPLSRRAAFGTTFLVGTFHPKTILFFVAFAAQFISADRPYLPQAALLTATFTGIAAATDTLYALAAARAARLVRNDGSRRWARRAGGMVLIAAGLAAAAMRNPI